MQMQSLKAEVRFFLEGQRLQERGLTSNQPSYELGGRVTARILRVTTDEDY
jgi:hypothetical protein